MASTMNRFYFLTLTAPIALTVACSVQEGHPADMDAGTAGANIGGSSTKATGTSSAGGSTITGGSGAIAGGSSTGGSTLTAGGSQTTGGSTSVAGTGINAGGSSAGNSSVAAGGTQAVGGTSGAGGSNPTSSTTAFGGAGGIAATLTGGETGNVGGVTSAGGTTGNAATGGIPSTGGTVGAGGVSVTGGASSTGGSVATGGTLTGGAATGGTPPTGGAPSTGGATVCTISSSSGPVIYQNGTANSANACQICDVTVSTSAWNTMPEGTGCGTSGGTVCHANACVAGCYIGSTYYAANAVNACQTCQPSVSTTAWSLTDGTICGCTGSLESVQVSTGLCVAKMVLITAPSASNNYSIDATEVTSGQYDLWLATKPKLPASTDANCSYVTSYAEQGTSNAYTGTNAAHHPVVNVDWCDAYAYCKGVGKRLCGAIGGGSNAYASYTDAALSQWYRVCSSGGADTYPYGNTYQATYCDGYDYGTDQTVAVGSLGNCVTSTTGYAGAYDLSGNVWEWEDSCDDTGQSAPCRLRGGCFNIYSTANLTCGGDFGVRNFVGNFIGFRCCSP